MGRKSPWLAYVGLHDGSGGGTTVLFLDSPTNVRFPCKWFVRNNPYACASCSFMFKSTRWSQKRSSPWTIASCSATVRGLVRG